MRFDIITVLPEIFKSVFNAGVLKKGIEKGLIEIRVHNLRDYAIDKHRQVDDRPFGGGEGMVLKPEPLFRAVEKIKEKENSRIILLSPQGRKFDYKLAEEFSNFPQIILICGRYEGVDERVREHLITDEISIGDYVLSGGEYAALVIIDAVARFIPGVVGKEESVKKDSFSLGLLDYPQYTRPREFRGWKVPDVLLTGDHKKIEIWRKKKSLEITLRKRPDLLEQKELNEEEKKLLDEIKKEISSEE
ncbi:tRNA (guanosine(37)-N1)-methyltransferase TrmD [SCandidatus Aminicenantes bacterium Aminicenantia_JdfR_composite]|jgi:tRNA (guanine37-N1)-methyltransferase|nr:tRNA (guanosine(37)-N1)-methyltransferase TrmD [SCandidatus Aminicenantes bacterium Aminicenantia_JdfR_composite]MCP2597741.1 tRNA (guanosine(37)-N1)-methyltransferase TrmD [Candidatus Aminicenantes bacterium AC-335-L06]